LTVIANVCGDDEPHALFAVTVISPLAVLAVALIEFDEEVPVHPDGNVHVYVVAPLTGDTEYVLTEDEQIVVFPEIVPGVEGNVLIV
jgi:hypothetical protein